MLSLLPTDEEVATAELRALLLYAKRDNLLSNSIFGVADKVLDEIRQLFLKHPDSLAIGKYLVYAITKLETNLLSLVTTLIEPKVMRTLSLEAN